MISIINMAEMAYKRKKLLLWIMAGGGLLVILAALAAIIVSQTATAKITPLPVTIEGVKGLAVADAKAAFDDNAAVFVDVRDQSAYEHMHIPGALLIPLNELTQHLTELEPSSWIITYCT